MEKDYEEVRRLEEALLDAKGEIDYTFLNDYMFRSILQKSNRVLKALVCVLLKLSPEEVTSVEITNPIELGKSIDDKKFILDIKVKINNADLLNLEMQLINYKDWPERSLQYLCRTYDSLLSGEDYINTKKAIHIGFLDFTLFEDHPEFIGTYRLYNANDHHLYTDKFEMRYVDMTRLDLATDKDSGVTKWVKLFKAKTWEEMKMIAEKDADMLEATENLYTSNSDQTARDIAFHRQLVMQREKAREKELADLAWHNQMAMQREKAREQARIEKERLEEERKLCLAQEMNNELETAENRPFVFEEEETFFA